MTRTLFVVLVMLFGGTVSAQDRARIGLLPFDIANVGGGTAAAAQALAKLVRVELITDKRVQPMLLDLPAGARLPLSAAQLAALADDHDLDLIVAGTVLDAQTTRGSNRVSTRGIGGLGGVGTRVSRTRAEVSMHVELVTRNGEVSHTFQVEGNNTDVGVGADIWTSLGGFDLGDPSWDKSPMGKALREAARKLAAETIRHRP